MLLRSHERRESGSRLNPVDKSMATAGDRLLRSRSSIIEKELGQLVEKSWQMNPEGNVRGERQASEKYFTSIKEV